MKTQGVVQFQKDWSSSRKEFLGRESESASTLSILLAIVCLLPNGKTGLFDG
jgi:hypothetical protein